MTHPDTYRDWDAAYVLGALSRSERAEFEEHLTTCDACAAAVAELTDLPGILGRLDPGDVALAGEPAPRSTDELAARRRARSTPGRRWLAGAAAACVLALGAGSAGTALLLADESPATVAMSAVGGSPVTADLAVTTTSWGTELQWSCDYGDGWRRAAGWEYELVVTTTDGTQVVVATWTADGRSAEHLTAASAVPESRIRTVDIRRAGTDAPLAVAAL